MHDSIRTIFVMPGDFLAWCFDRITKLMQYEFDSIGTVVQGNIHMISFNNTRCEYTMK